MNPVIGQVNLDNIYDRISKIVNDYSQACSVPCKIINLQGEILHQSGKILELGLNNVKLYFSICEQAELLCGKSIFLDSAGFTYVVSPVIKGETIAGSLVAGPVCVDEMDISPVHYEHFPNYPVISRDRLNSLRELLHLASKTISNRINSQLETSIDSSGQRSGGVKRNSDFMFIDRNIEKEISYSLEKECKLLDSVERGDKASAQEVLNEILGAVFFANSANYDVILTRATELVVLLSRAAIRGGADAQQIFGLNFSCLNKIHAFRTVDEIAYWLSGVMARFTDQVFNSANTKHANMIFQAKDYVKKNYMKKINMEDVAARVYLSPAYFSRMFKKEVGENFNLYVNQVRVDMAKKMLISESDTLAAISTSVGFEGQSYFSKVFRKMTGVTPNKYRESRGRMIS